MSEIKEPTYDVKLTASEIILLDGKCRDAIQAEVSRAMSALAYQAGGIAPHIASMITKIVAEAEKSGKLVYRPRSIRICPCCNRSDGYFLVK